MTALIIAGAVLAVLGLLLFSPAKVYVSYKRNGNGVLAVHGSVGFFKFLIYESSEEKTKKEEIEEKKEKKPIKSPAEGFKSIKNYFENFSDMLSYLKKRMIIYNFKFNVRIGTGDAASTGILTGTAWGVLYDILAVLDNNFVVKKHDIKVAPDFLSETLLLDIETVLGLKTIYDLFLVRKYLIPKGERGEKQ